MRTDEREDVIASLKLFVDTSSVIETDDAYWKWAIISLHSALQSMMVFYLSFGTDLLVMSQEDAEAWLDAHENDSQYPKTKMDGFLNLYAKIKKHEVLGNKFIPQGQEGGSIKKLNRFRNEFVHFMPKGWSIEMSGMPAIFTDCLSNIKSLGSGSVSSRWEDQEQYEKYKQLVVEAENCILNLQNH